MTDIDSNRDTNATRTDRDNEKNLTSPIRGGNNADDIDERNRVDSPRREDEAAQVKDKGDPGVNVPDEDNVLERDKQIP